MGEQSGSSHHDHPSVPAPDDCPRGDAHWLTRVGPLRAAPHPSTGSERVVPQTTGSGSPLDVRGPSVPREGEVLTPEALEFVADLQREFGARRNELLARRRERRDEIARTHRLDFLPETRDVRNGSWQVAAAPPDLIDRRVEITGPTEPKMAINALNSGAGVAGRPRGCQHPALEQRRRRPAHPARRGTTHALLHLPRGQGVPPPSGRPSGRARGPSPRLAPGRAAPAARRHTGRRRTRRLRAVLLPQRRRAAPSRQRPVLLPAEDRESPRGAALERRLHPRRATARDPVRQRPRHRPHRDDHGRLRDGGDPVRAPRSRERAQRRALGLSVQPDQELP